MLQAVTGQTVDTFDPTIQLVTDNSFPPVVALQPQQYPEFFLLHGESDTLVPSRQSQRLCDALSGTLSSFASGVGDGSANGNAEESADFTSLLKSTACDDRGSQLHLIAQGDHALDLCVSDELCRSGTPASARATAGIIQSMLDWSSADTLSSFNQAAGDGDNSGSGRLDLQLILLLIALLLWRLTVPKRAPPYLSDQTAYSLPRSMLEVVSPHWIFAKLISP